MEGQFTPGKALLPARLHMKVLLFASVLANAPATPLFRKVMKVPLLKPELAERPLNAADRIGSGAWPGSPLFAKLQAGFPGSPHFGFAAIKSFKLFCALRNSFKKPFSKMLTSLRLSWRQRPVA